MDRDQIRAEWDLLVAMPYPSREVPPGSSESVVEGIDLALLDGDASAVVEWYLNPNLADPDTALIEVTRASALAALERVVPRLQPAAQAYFRRLLGLLREIDRAVAEEEAAG